jgi:hypothetical protein
MDLTRLRAGELIAAGAAMLLFLTMFVPWYGGQGTVVFTPSGPDTALNAWQAFSVVDLLLFAAIVAAVGAAVLAGTQSSVALPVAASVLVCGLGVVVTVLVLYRLVDEPRVDPYTSIEPGAYVGLALCAAIALGGWLSMRDEGTSFSRAASELERRWATDDVPVEPAPAAPTKPPQDPPPAR